MLRFHIIILLIVIVIWGIGTNSSQAQVGGLDELEINLGEDVADRVIHPQLFDGNTQIVNVGGMLCRENVTLNHDYHFYFSVDDSVIFQGNHPELDITIHYYDSGTGLLKLQYDSSDTAPFPDDVYKSAGTVNLTNTGTWQQHTFHITDAYFGNRQNGGTDFRVVKPDGSRYWLDLVTVTIPRPRNSILGATNVAGDYNFRPQRHLLNDGAIEIADAGFRVIKIWVNPGSTYPNPTALMQEPHYKEVLNRPFETYILTVIAGGGFKDGFTTEEYDSAVQIFSELAEYLLQNYNRTGKVFIIGHHEGDWKLRQYKDPWDPAFDPPQVDIDGFIDMYSARAAGVALGRENTPHSDVWVYSAGEVNLVKSAMVDGRPTITNTVLPYLNPPLDLMSYSAWDTLNDTFSKGEATGRANFSAALAYIADHMPDSAILDPYGQAFGDKNIFLGEFGAPGQQLTNQGRDGDALQELTTRVGVEEALAFGCPWIAYWQVYCNECYVVPPVTNEDCRGFWLRKVDGTYSLAWSYLTGLIGPHLTPTTDFNAQLADSHFIELIWNDTPGELAYHIEKSINNNDYILLDILPQDTQSYIDSTYTPGEDVRYRIRTEGLNDPATPWFYTQRITTIGVPDTPDGLSISTINTPITFVTGGTSCNTSDEIEYRFDWGDGTVSEWGPNSQSHSWTTGGIFTVRAIARCVEDSQLAAVSPLSSETNIIIIATVQSDFDFDGDVDQEDFAHLQNCYTPLGQAIAPGCQAADLNDDGSVTIGDFNIFHPCMNGANRVPGC